MHIRLRILLFLGVAVILVSAGALGKDVRSAIPESATPQPSASVKRVVATGDIVCAPLAARTPLTCQDKATYELAQKLAPDAVLLLGDLQYERGEADNFSQGFDVYWGKLKHKSYPVPGNHEYRTPAAAGYYGYFKERAGDPTKGYYSFDLGAWHVVALNSVCDAVGGCGEGSPQYKWLQQDLAKSTKVCTLAMWHHPSRTSGKHTEAESLAAGQLFWRALYEHGADVILNGHDHLYERFAPLNTSGLPDTNGVRQFTVGTGGRSLYKAQTAHPASQKIIDTQYGVLELELSSDSYTWRFTAVDGTSPDSGTAKCVR